MSNGLTQPVEFTACAAAICASPGRAARGRRGVALLPVHPPLACPLLARTGIPCPLCGMTRAVVAAVHGDIIGSLRSTRPACS